MIRRALLAVLATAALAARSGAQPGPSGAAPAPGPNAGPGPSPPDSWVARGSAELIVLDKLRAQPVPMTVKVGEHASFGTLVIGVTRCQTRPPDLPQNSAAFLEITDSRGSAPVFQGWVLSNTPAVSQFEHPVYDLRLVACK